LALKKEIKKINKKILFTTGCFDIFHYGHLIFLKKFSKLNGYKILGINSDNSIKNLKGKNRPVNKLKFRLGLLKELNYLDAIIIFNSKTPKKLLEILKPDEFVKGSEIQNGKFKKKQIYNDIVRNVKKISTIKMINNISTSKIVDKILGRK
jgi:rfaE bifunctional protein nucleotidyltransferase chain/domain